MSSDIETEKTIEQIAVHIAVHCCLLSCGTR
jgi:hypothetical protein